MQRTFYRIILPLLCAILAGCGVLSVNPISPPDKNIKDKSLLGVWTIKDGSSSIFIHIGQLDENKMKAVYIEHKENGELDMGFFSIYPSNIDAHKFLNLQFIEPDGKPNEDLNLYIFLKYKFKSPDVLSVMFLSSDLIEKAVEEKELIGILPKREPALKLENKDQPSVHIMKNYFEITDSSANIAKFIHRYGAGRLFEKELLLNRYKQ